jgi:adhesin transport system outer membrane protein
MAQTRLWQAQAQRESVLAELRTAESSLLALTQQAVDSTPPIPAAVLDLPEPAQLEVIVLSQSASLRQREALLALAQSDENRQARSGMPVLTIQSSRTYFSDQKSSRNTTGVNLLLEANLDGLGFSLRGQVAAAALRREAARQDIILARHDMQVRVRQLQEKRVSDQRLIAGYMQSIALLEETLASFRRQYESGYKSWLDLLNIARELSDQQLQLALVQADWRLQTLRLAAMSGRLDALAQLSSSPDVQP